MLLALAAVFALAFYFVSQMDIPQAWAKQSGVKSGASSRVTAPPANTGNTGASQGSAVQAKKKKKTSGDEPVKYMEFKMNEVLISN